MILEGLAVPTHDDRLYLEHRRLRPQHQDPFPCSPLVFQKQASWIGYFLGGKMISFSQIQILVTPPLGWFKCSETEGMARARV